MRNPRRRSRLSAALATGTIACLLAAASTPAGAAPARPASGPAYQELAAGAEATRITLITGETVEYRVTPDGRAAVSIPDDTTSSYYSYAGPDGHYLIPSAAAPYLQAGLLDRRLFDVTYLAEHGYDDAHMPALPVIVEFDPAARTVREPAGALPASRVTQVLESIGAAGLAVDKSDAGRFWDRVTSGEVSKVWLDQMATTTLAESVPQIGAPQAWAAGYDGTGVTVAVLDTGIDPDHPDLAGQIAGTENFTDEQSVVDGNGHGTHVAATLAGTGAASGGSFRGVAPGADLLVGKVLGRGGTGLTSWIIDGMEWAADQGADVVNLSLGTGSASSGTDPLSRAVDRLTDSHDVLFVVAAGNTGPEASSVNGPGAAAAALTVGAVDKQDQLAEFSSRGPVRSNQRIKPEITAPGMAIVAARAAGGSDMGGEAEPVDDHYARASGTSMATPHVAGAAAIVAQQHPDWDPTALKAALVGAALPQDGSTAYEQGGGRVDIARAITQPVHPDTATLSLGFFDWPHDGSDDLVTRTVGYTNLTEDPLPLDLRVEVADEDGTPAPAGTLALGASSVTVPAGGTGTVSLTLDPNLAGVGAHGGYLIASTGDVVVRTPVGFVLEGPMYHLTVAGIARTGNPAGAFDAVQVFGLETGVFDDQFFSGGTATFRLPPGDYSVMSFLEVRGDGHRQDFQQALVGDPEFRLTGDTTLMLDARDSVEVVPVTPDETEPLALRLGYARTAGGETVSSFLASPTATRVFAVPTGAVSGGFEFYTRWTLLAPDLVVEVVEPERFGVRQEYLVGSPRLDGHHRLALVDAGAGRPEDFDGRDVAGKAVLMQRGSVSFAAQAQNAAAAGARLAMIFNDRAGRLNGSVGDSPIPAVAVSQEPGEQLRQLLRAAEVELELHGIAVSPYRYDLVIPHPDRIPGSLTYDVRELDLATLRSDYHSHLPGQVMGASRFGWRPYETLSVDFVQRLPAPFQRIEYVSANDTRWRADVHASYPFGGTLSERLVRYQPGEQRAVSWFRQPARPAVREAAPFDPGLPVVREHDELVLNLLEFSDAEPGHYGPREATDMTAFRLLRDGQLIAEAARGTGRFGVPAEPGTYRAELDVQRTAPWWLLSTRTRTAWTFRSERPAGDQPRVVPLLLVDYDLDVDPLNTVPPPRERRLPPLVGVQVRHQAGTEGGAGPIAGARLWISYNDGASWLPRPGRLLGDGRYEFVLPFRPPATGTGFGSLRFEAWDAAGNRVEQEIIRAVRS